MNLNIVPFETLLGLTFKSVERIDVIYDELIFTTVDDKVYTLEPADEYCSDIYIECIVGDLADLIGNPITVAYEASPKESEWAGGTCTWTFYKLATIKGYVDIRWYGESNGYYCESARLVKKF